MFSNFGKFEVIIGLTICIRGILATGRDNEKWDSDDAADNLTEDELDFELISGIYDLKNLDIKPRKPVPLQIVSSDSETDVFKSASMVEEYGDKENNESNKGVDPNSGTGTDSGTKKLVSEYTGDVDRTLLIPATCKSNHFNHFSIIIEMIFYLPFIECDAVNEAESILQEKNLMKVFWDFTIPPCIDGEECFEWMIDFSKKHINNGEYVPLKNLNHKSKALFRKIKNYFKTAAAFLKKKGKVPCIVECDDFLKKLFYVIAVEYPAGFIMSDNLSELVNYIAFPVNPNAEPVGENVFKILVLPDSPDIIDIPENYRDIINKSLIFVNRMRVSRAVNLYDYFLETRKSQCNLSLESFMKFLNRFFGLDTTN